MSDKPFVDNEDSDRMRAWARAALSGETAVVPGSITGLSSDHLRAIAYHDMLFDPVGTMGDGVSKNGLRIV